MSNHGLEANVATAARAARTRQTVAPTSREGRRQAERAAHAAFAAARAHVEEMARPGGKGAPSDEIDRMHAHQAALDAAMRAGWQYERAALLANPFGAEHGAARAWQGAMAQLDKAAQLDRQVQRIEAPQARLRARISALHAKQTDAFYAQRAGKITQAQYETIIARTTRQLAPIRAREQAEYEDRSIGVRSSALAKQARGLRAQADAAMQEQMSSRDHEFRALRAGQVVELRNAEGQRAYLTAHLTTPEASTDRQGLTSVRFSVYSPSRLTYGIDSKQKAETFLTPSSPNFQSGDLGSMRSPWVAWPYMRAMLQDAGYLPSGQTYPTLIATRAAILKANQAENRAAKASAKRAAAKASSAQKAGA